jgi:hypothetical protein
MKDQPIENINANIVDNLIKCDPKTIVYNLSGNNKDKKVNCKIVIYNLKDKFISIRVKLILFKKD